MGAVVKPSGRQERAIFIVRFLPEDRSIWIEGPADVFQAAASCDILLEQPCAGASSCGMRAGEGAIDALHIETDGRWSVHTIGDVPPRGICGSGLLDAVAELVRVGVIDASGYMRAPDELVAVVPVALRQRIEQRETSRAVSIVDEGSGHRRVELRATDVRQLQLAIAAIRAGIDMLCVEAGVDAAELYPVLVAGTFGRFVRKSGMLRLGLVAGAVAERVRTVGNAAGLAARLALLDQRFRARAERFATRTRYIELAGREDYEEALTRALRFPERGGSA